MSILGAIMKFNGAMKRMGRGYEVMCKYCGSIGYGFTLQEAIKALQRNEGKCGENWHDPIITHQPE